MSKKICVRCLDTKGFDEFEKHRAVCRLCRSVYHKNRREDLKDGSRDSENWYESSEPSVIEPESERKDTSVYVMPEIELRDTHLDSQRESRNIFYVFLLVWAVIIYVIVCDWADGLRCSLCL